MAAALQLSRSLLHGLPIRVFHVHVCACRHQSLERSRLPNDRRQKKRRDADVVCGLHLRPALDQCLDCCACPRHRSCVQRRASALVESCFGLCSSLEQLSDGVGGVPCCRGVQGSRAVLVLGFNRRTKVHQVSNGCPGVTGRRHVQRSAEELVGCRDVCSASEQCVDRVGAVVLSCGVKRSPPALGGPGVGRHATKECGRADEPLGSDGRLALAAHWHSGPDQHLDSRHVTICCGIVEACHSAGNRWAQPSPRHDSVPH
mmetsp:Transcript_26772/g.53783  ORF Transcript_26772/g.53783 Transcript_26772/m.53783 type:complete len:259 (+) Transcript_26772:104-880(+)